MTHPASPDREPVCERASDHVRIPTTESEAALMVLLGTRWLEDNAPHRLKSDATPAAPVDERAAFEASDPLRIHTRDAEDRYVNWFTLSMWEGWKLRASLAAAPTAEPAGARAVEWIRNNYQDFPTVDSLCMALSAALATPPAAGLVAEPPEQP